VIISDGATVRNNGDWQTLLDPQSHGEARHEKLAGRFAAHRLRRTRRAQEIFDEIIAAAHELGFEYRS
jgi:hypothetical protein